LEPDSGKVTWSAAWPTVLLSQFLYTESQHTVTLPTVLLSQFLYTESHSTPSLYRQFCCLSSCTPTITAHRHCTDSSAVSVPVHQQSQRTVTVSFAAQLIVSTYILLLH